MRIWEFENAVWNLDGVRIVVRGAAEDEVDDYASCGATIKLRLLRQSG